MFCLGQRYCPPPGGNTLRRYGYVLASLRAYAYAARLFRPAGSIRRATKATLERTKSRFDGVPMIGQ